MSVRGAGRFFLSSLTLWLAAGLFLSACVATPTPPPSIRLLEADRPISDRLTTGAVHDWQFVARAGEAVTVEFAPGDASGLRLEIRRPDGAILLTESATLLLPVDGVYTVRVRSALDVTPEASASEAAALETTDEAGLVEVTQEAVDLTYSLRLLLPDRPTAGPTLRPSRTSPPTRTPTDTPTPTETPVPTETRIPTETEPPTLTPTETLTPSLTPSLTPTFTPSPVHAGLGALLGRLLVNIPYEGEFLSAFDRHVFQFSGGAGQYATLGLAALEGSGIDPRLTLYDSSGNALATDDDSGGGLNALIRDVRLSREDEYYVQAIGGADGTYRLTLALADTPSSNSAQPAGGDAPSATPVRADADARLRENAPILGAVEPGGLFSRYFLPAQAGDVLTIEARATDGSPLRLALELYTPAGELMTRVPADASGAAIRGIGVIETGLYPLFVTDDGEAGGGFTLVWRYDARATPPTPQPQIILSVTDPLPAGTYLYYPFQGGAGMRVRVVVEALGGGLDPVAALIGPAGETIADGDDSDGTLNPVFEALLPAEGTYVVRVNAYGDSAGDARVIVERLP